MKRVKLWHISDSSVRFGTCFIDQFSRDDSWSNRAEGRAQHNRNSQRCLPGSLVMSRHLFSHTNGWTDTFMLSRVKSFDLKHSRRSLHRLRVNILQPADFPTFFPLRSGCLSPFPHWINSDPQWDTKRLQMATVASCETEYKRKASRSLFPLRNKKLHLLQS